MTIWRPLWHSPYASRAPAIAHETPATGKANTRAGLILGVCNDVSVRRIGDFTRAQTAQYWLY